MSSVLRPVRKRKKVLYRRMTRSALSAMYAPLARRRVMSGSPARWPGHDGRDATHRAEPLSPAP